MRCCHGCTCCTCFSSLVSGYLCTHSAVLCTSIHTHTERVVQTTTHSQYAHDIMILCSHILNHSTSTNACGIPFVCRRSLVERYSKDIFSVVSTIEEDVGTTCRSLSGIQKTIVCIYCRLSTVHCICAA